MTRAAIQSLYHALGHDHQLFMASAGEQGCPCLQHAPDLSVAEAVFARDDSGIDASAARSVPTSAPPTYPWCC